MAIPPPPFRVAQSKSTAPVLPSSQPVALAVAGADALSSIATIVGVTFFAAYKAAGGGRAGALAGLATVPVVGVGLWAFGSWYSDRPADNVTMEPELKP